MKTALKTFLGVAGGLATAFVLVIAVEFFSSVVHPLPKDFNNTMEEMCRHVARYPDWILGVVVLAWSATAFVSTRVAVQVGNRWAGFALVLLLSAGIVSNIAMLPYATWFKVVMLISFAAACSFALTRNDQTPPPATDPSSL